MKSKENSPGEVAQDEVAFGRTCRRCGVYFVSNSRTENLCPWCVRIQTGRNDEMVVKEVDDLIIVGF